MKQWQFSLWLAALLLPCAFTIIAFLLEKTCQMFGILLFLLGFYAVVTGLYYHTYEKDREFEG